jgi:subtilase family serine protease
MKLDYVTMVLKPTAAQQSDLETLLIRQQDRSSADYHKWLTPEQFGDRFGLAVSDITEIRSWIEAQGFHVEDTARGRNWIAFSGTVAQIQRAFDTEIHRFLVDGKAHYANATDPSVPAALADVVGYFRGLDDFQPEPQAGIRNETPFDPAYTSSTGAHSMAPDDFAAIYNLTPLYQNGIYGDQQKIAVLGCTDVDLAGYQTFRSLYRLPATAPVMHLVGTDPGLPSSEDLGEAMLDLELAGAVARNATIVYVYAASIYTAAQEAVDKNLAPVISLSYASCEARVPDTLRYVAQQANAQGITEIAALQGATCTTSGSSHPPVSAYRIRRPFRKSRRWAGPCSTRDRAPTGSRQTRRQALPRSPTFPRSDGTRMVQAGFTQAGAEPAFSIRNRSGKTGPEFHRTKRVTSPISPVGGEP